MIPIEIQVTVIQELESLLQLNGGIGENSNIKKILTSFFRNKWGKRQHDANDALLNILKCVPKIQKMFMFSSLVLD